MTANIISELSKLRPNATFLSLKEYKNDSGEIANYNIVFHISYKNALQKSISLLNDIIPENDLEITAKKELLDGYQKSFDKSDDVLIEEDIDKTYGQIYNEHGEAVKGIKLHLATNTLYIYGLIVNKNVLQAGVYPKTNKRPLTIAKDKLRYNLPVNKFRQFKITNDKVNCISVENLSLIPQEIINDH